MQCLASLRSCYPRRLALLPAGPPSHTTSAFLASHRWHAPAFLQTKRWASNQQAWAALGLDGSRAAAYDRAAVKRAYLQRAKACHPDLHGASAENTRAFQRLSRCVAALLVTGQCVLPL